MVNTVDHEHKGVKPYKKNRLSLVNMPASVQEAWVGIHSYKDISFLHFNLWVTTNESMLPLIHAEKNQLLLKQHQRSKNLKHSH